jgi:hypothetical protein
MTAVGFEKPRDLWRIKEGLSGLFTAQMEVRVNKRVKRRGRVEGRRRADPLRRAG